MSGDFDEINRTLGRLEANVASLCTRISKVEVNTDCMRSTLDQAKGGWRLGVALTTAGGVAGATLTKLLPWLVVWPR